MIIGHNMHLKQIKMFEIHTNVNGFLSLNEL